MAHSIDLEKEFEKALDEEIAKEFRDQFELSDVEYEKAVQVSKETGKLLSTCVIDAHIVKEIFKKVKNNE